jgi:hypothetical protein
MARTPPWKAASPRKKSGQGIAKAFARAQSRQTFGEKGRAALSEFGR